MSMIWFSIECTPATVGMVKRKLKQLKLPATTKTLTRGKYSGGNSSHLELRMWSCSPHQKTVTALSLVFDNDVTPFRIFNSLEEAWKAYPWDISEFDILTRMQRLFAEDDDIIIYPIRRV